MGFLKASLDFCEQFLLNKFLLKLGQKISSKFLLQLSIIVEFIIFAIFSISSTHFWQQFPFNFFAKIATTICYQFLATVFSPRHKGVLLKTLLKGWNVTKDLSVTNSHWSFQCQRVGLKLRFHMGTLRLTSGWSRPSDKGWGKGRSSRPWDKVWGPGPLGPSPWSTTANSCSFEPREIEIFSFVTWPADLICLWLSLFYYFQLSIDRHKTFLF